MHYLGYSTYVGLDLNAQISSKVVYQGKKSKHFVPRYSKDYQIMKVVVCLCDAEMNSNICIITIVFVVCRYHFIVRLFKICVFLPVSALLNNSLRKDMRHGRVMEARGRCGNQKAESIWIL